MITALLQRLLLILLLPASITALNAQSFNDQPVVGPGDERSIALQPYLSLWVPDQAVDFATASAAANRNNYQPMMNNRAPVSGRDIWYRFALQPEPGWGHRAILDLGDILFEDVEVFVQTPQGIQRSIAGLGHPYSERPLPNRFIALPIAAPDNLVSEVYFRVRPLAGVQTGVTPQLLSDVQFYRESSRNGQIIAAVSGGMLVIMLFMFTVANLILHGRVLIIFLGFAASVMLLHLCHAGYISQWFDLSPASYRLLFILLPGLMNVMSLYYCRYLFEMRSNMPLLNRLITPFCIVYMALLLIPALLPVSWLNPVIVTGKSAISGFASLLVLAFGLRALQLNIKGAGYYLLGVFLFVAIVNITRLPSYDIISFNANSRTLLGIGALALMFCFAIATLQKIRQIAEREKQLEKQAAILENQNRVRTDFLISMSHEIRTPINGVLGMAQMLEKTRLDNGQRYYLDILSSAGRTLLNVVNEILDISKLEAGKLEVESIYFNLDQTLNYTVALFGQMNRKPGVLFYYENDPQLPVHVNGDPARLQQVLNNLFSNAFKFTDSGHVILRVKQVDSISSDRVLVRIEVEDSGIGISEDALGRLFSPFEQADATTARRFGGSGLGLAICKRVVELMGGQIHVASKPGEGSRFWADIPFNIAQREEQRYLNITRSLQHKRLTIVMRYPEFNPLYLSTLAHWQVQTTLIKPDQTPDSADWEHTDILYISDLLPMATLETWLEHARAENCPVLLVEGYGEDYRPSDLPETVQLRRLRQPVSKARMADLLYQLFNRIFPVENDRLNLPTSRHIAELFLLVAEDNDVNTKVLQAVFAKNHINAEFVVNGADALARYTAEPNRFDAILMDCEMPVMNGFDATRRIRQFEQANRLPPITIIALTAHALLETRNACLECGMNDILTKPVSFSALLSRLEALEKTST